MTKQVTKAEINDIKQALRQLARLYGELQSKVSANTNLKVSDEYFAGILKTQFKPFVDEYVAKWDKKVSALKDGDKGEPGKDAEITKEILDGIAKDVLAQIAKPENGKDAEITEQLIQDIVDRCISYIPDIEVPEVDTDAIEANITATLTEVFTEKLSELKAEDYTEKFEQLEARISTISRRKGGGGLSNTAVQKLIDEAIANSPETQTLQAVTELGATTDQDVSFTGSIAVPTGATPTLTVDGQIAVDNDVSGLDGSLTYRVGGQDMFALPLRVDQYSALINGYIPKYNSTSGFFELVPDESGGGGGNNTFINNIKVDTNEATNSQYGSISGVLDGVNTTFTVSNGSYAEILEVKLNGVTLMPGSTKDWQELSPANGTFTINTAPESTDELIVVYTDQETTTASVLVNKDTQTVTADYTILSTDGIIYVNASTGDMTITLPATTGLDRLGVDIKKIDNSGNSVTIVTPGSETIDNETDFILTTPGEDITIKTDGVNYWTHSNG